MPLASHAYGCFLGLSIGDALGAAVEFMPPGTFEPVTGYRAGGPHGLNAGEWTDDTSMALALADSIATAGWDLHDQMTRYVAWWQHGTYSVNHRCFDIGNTTRAALQRFQATGDALRSGSRSPQARGNGSIMRLAPVPIRFSGLFPDNLKMFSGLAGESSRTTHASEQCVSACRYLALLECGLIHGLDREQVLSPDWGPLSELRRIKPLSPDIEEIAAGSFRRRRPPEIVGSGHVVKSLEAALWAFHDAPDFETAVMRAVNLGHDADTTGAVCGQLAGAFWCLGGIPKRMLNGLAKRDTIMAATERLLIPDEQHPA